MPVIQSSVSKPLLRAAMIGSLGGLLFDFDTALIAGSTSALSKVFARTPATLGLTVSSALWDTVIGAAFSGSGDILHDNGHRHMLRGGNAVSLTDLRQGPSVFIGAFDNAWTMRLARGLRYYFAGGPQLGLTRSWIEDAQSPQHTRSVLSYSQVESNNYVDLRDCGSVSPRALRSA